MDWPPITRPVPKLTRIKPRGEGFTHGVLMKLTKSPMQTERIHKRSEDCIGANLPDYEALARTFTWPQARALLDGLPGGGLNIAYDAMQRAVAGKPDPMVDGLTREQRFFIGWATSWRKSLSPERLKVLVASDPHAPPQIRATVPVTNMPTFAQAFGCKDGDPMVRTGEKLVAIW